MHHALTQLDLVRLPICADIIAAKGAASPYVGDCVVRAYQGSHLREVCRELGWACDYTTSITVTAGIGSLVMTWTGNRLVAPPTPRAATAAPDAAAPSPSPSPSPSPERLPAPSDLREERERVCAGCTHHAADRCLVAGCACAGLGQPAARFSRCPVGRW